MVRVAARCGERRFENAEQREREEAAPVFRRGSKGFSGLPVLPKASSEFACPSRCAALTYRELTIIVCAGEAPGKLSTSDQPWSS